MLGAVAVSAAAFEPPLPAIAVHVQDYAATKGATLAEAQRLTDRIFADVGVRLVWTTTPDAPPDLHVRERVTLLLLSDEMSRLKIAAERLAPAVLAQTPRGSRRIYVLSGRVQEASRLHSRPPAVMLGVIIAHELGHVLLPPGHSPRGVMRNAAYLANSASRFTAREGAAIREKLAGRAPASEGIVARRRQP